jgi:hypothetical protein
MWLKLEELDAQERTREKSQNTCPQHAAGRSRSGSSVDLLGTQLVTHPGIRNANGKGAGRRGRVVVAPERGNARRSRSVFHLHPAWGLATPLVSRHTRKGMAHWINAVSPTMPFKLGRWRLLILGCTATSALFEIPSPTSTINMSSPKWRIAVGCDVRSLS